MAELAEVLAYSYGALMAKVKNQKRDEQGVPQMPFDDALRKILSAPPQHKAAKKKAKKKSGGSN